MQSGSTAGSAIPPGKINFKAVSSGIKRHGSYNGRESSPKAGVASGEPRHSLPEPSHSSPKTCRSSPDGWLPGVLAGGFHPIRRGFHLKNPAAQVSRGTA